MKKFNPFKRKISPYKITDKVRVKKSYYTFSEEYPRDRFQISRRKKLLGRRKKFRLAMAIVSFTLIFALSYFAVSVSLSVSNAPIDTSFQTVVDTSLTDRLKEEGVRALYMPSEKLSDVGYIKDLLREIYRKNCNSVVIDFKGIDGKLAYTSFQKYAIMGRCNVFDNDTVRKAINLFSENEITVIARIYCFEDPIVPEVEPDIAVKYMDTDVNWRDTKSSSGHSWLNPVSKRARNYLYGIIKELYAMNIKGFMLESVQFPDGAKNGATFPGEKDSGKRNEVLLNFIENVKKKLKKDAFIILSESASDASKGNEEIYFGSLSGASAFAVAADTRERDENVLLDKREKFSSLISMYGEISRRYPKKTVIPIISMEEYSRSYIRNMKRSGYTSYILIDENGDY